MGFTHKYPFLVIKKGANEQYYLKYSDSAVENGCKPSVDVLFRSAAEVFQEQVLALLLTGMGTDGVKGIGILKSQGAITLAQDQASSVVWGMPGYAREAGYIDQVIPLDKIADKLRQIAG